jgi:hypothetical protein
MKKLFDRFRYWLAADKISELMKSNQELSFNWMSEQAAREAAEEMSMWYRAQLMTLRVAQAEPPRVGWEVMAYIPQEVADKLGTMPLKQRVEFVRHVADVLTARAINGLHHVNSQGRVNALVFAPISLKSPAAPEWCAVRRYVRERWRLQDE